MEFDDTNNSPKKGINNSRNSTEKFPSNITIEKEQSEKNSHERTDD